MPLPLVCGITQVQHCHLVPSSRPSPLRGPSSDIFLNARCAPGFTANGMHSTLSQNGQRKSNAGTSSALANLVQSLGCRGSGEMTSSKIIGADYEAILEWIRSERMRKLPPEGSSYDRVLVWARLFVERLHSFDSAIQHFEGDSHMAAELAYIHCASLLEVCLVRREIEARY
jgi:hypothetical protein